MGVGLRGQGGYTEFRGHKHHSPRAKQKRRKASCACTPHAWSFSRGGSSLTPASLPPTTPTLGLEEEEGEERTE